MIMKFILNYNTLFKIFYQHEGLGDYASKSAHEQNNRKIHLSPQDGRGRHSVGA